MARILLVDDEASILSVLNTLLKAEGYDVESIQDGNQAVETIKSEEFDLMISDIRMTPINGMELLKLAHDVRPNMMVIMVTAFGSVETAVEAMKMGAYDYVTKPFKIDELLITVERALEYRRAVSENVDLKAQVGALYKYENIVAESDAMRNVCEMIEHVALTDTTVLVSGEGGTGKELVARTIHEQSKRKDAEFVSVDCSSLAAEVIETELFGSGSGEQAQKGVFERAAGGTVFVNAIGSAPMTVQEQLLALLLEKSITRSGGAKKITVDVRLLAGTDTDLQQLIAAGKFREDLFYRLSVIPIMIRPLRERKDDVLPLVYHIVRRELADGKEMPGLEPAVTAGLINYAWPGNVQELEDVLKQVVSSIEGDAISVDQLPDELKKAAAGGPEGAAGADQHGDGPADDYRGKSLKAFLRNREKEYLDQVLEHTGGDKGAAAKALKISLATLYRKLPGEETPESQD